MSTEPALDLRSLVAAAVRDAIGDMVTASVRESLANSPPAQQKPGLPTSGPEPAHDYSGQNGRVESVRITNDTDLNTFARHLLTLFDNPKKRQDLRAGRLRFGLAPSPAAATPGPVAATRRIDRGAVTERHVKAASEAGEQIILGPRAVITPLGRERARALGVHITKER